MLEINSSIPVLRGGVPVTQTVSNSDLCTDPNDASTGTRSSRSSRIMDASYCALVILTMSRPASFLNLGFPLCAHTLRVLTHLSPGSCLLELLVIFLTAVLRGLGMELLGVGPPRRGGEAQRRTIGVHLLCGLNDGLQDISKARVSISPFIKPTLSKITPMNEISPEPHVHVPQTTTL